MILSKRAIEGYLLIDHTNAPAAGDVPAGVKWESATLRCSHCHRIVVLNPDRSRPRTYCPKCDRYLCDGCAAVAHTTLDCVPLDAVLETLHNDATR